MLRAGSVTANPAVVMTSFGEKLLQPGWTESR